MKYNLSLFATLFCLFTSTACLAQDFEPPKNPDIHSKEGLQALEKDVIAAADWLESTPIGSEQEKRQITNAFVVAWLSNTPNVSLMTRVSILKLFDKNVELVGVYMAGYARYCLQNNYSKDELMAQVAGVRSVIKCYLLGGEVKKDKTLQKLIEEEQKGGLEELIKKKMENIK